MVNWKQKGEPHHSNITHIRKGQECIMRSDGSSSRSSDNSPESSSREGSGGSRRAFDPVRQRSDYLKQAAEKGRAFRSSIEQIGDTSTTFNNRYTSSITDRGGDIVAIKTRVKDEDKFCYKSWVDLSKREIEVYSLLKANDQCSTVEETSALPASEMIWHQYQEVVQIYNIPSKPSRIKFSTIRNDDTTETLNICFPSQISETIIVDKTTQEYDAIAQTSLGKIAFRMVKQHYENSEISSTEIKKFIDEDGDLDIELTFKVD